MNTGADQNRPEYAPAIEPFRVDTISTVELETQLDPLPQANGGFRVIFADPPWLFKSNSLAAPGRNPRRHYGCETIEKLCKLPLADRLA